MMMSMTQPFNPATEELHYICGDKPDPSGKSNLRGVEAGIDLKKSAFAHPLIRWRDRVIEGDLYLEANNVLRLHLICPKCSTPEIPHGLHIRSDQKHMEWDAKNGLLSVEPFTCPWE